MFIGETIQLGAPTYALERWHVLLYSLVSDRVTLRHLLHNNY